MASAAHLIGHKFDQGIVLGSPVVPDENRMAIGSSGSKEGVVQDESTQKKSLQAM